MTNIVYVDTESTIIHVYTLGKNLTDYNAFAKFCLDAKKPLFSAHFLPKNPVLDRHRRPEEGYGLLDEIHYGRKTSGLILSEEDVTFEKNGQLDSSKITQKITMRSDKCSEEIYAIVNAYLEEQLNRDIIVDTSDCCPKENNPFGVNDGKNTGFYMTTASSDSHSVGMDDKTLQLVINGHCSMNRIAALNPEGAAYVALVKGRGEILNGLDNLTVNNMFDHLGLEHFQISFEDFINGQRAFAIFRHGESALSSVTEKELNRYPTLAKTPYQTSIDKMNNYIKIKSTVIK